MTKYFILPRWKQILFLLQRCKKYRSIMKNRDQKRRRKFQEPNICQLLPVPVGIYIYMDKVWNMFKVNNRDTRATLLTSLFCFYY